MLWTSNKVNTPENEPAKGYAISFINGGLYEVVATNIGEAILVRATPTSTEPLLPPQKLSVLHLGKDGFKLEWQQVQGATGYEIDVAIDEYFSTMVAGFSGNQVSGTTYEIESLFPNRFYYFRVRAYRQTDASTDYSAFSATIANIRYVQAKPKKRKHPLWLYLFGSTTGAE